MQIPPYGKDLSDLIKSGKKPSNSIYLFIGKNAWNEAKISNELRPCRTLLLPPFESPIFFNWPVKQCDILIYDTGDCSKDYIEFLAFTLLESQAEIVRVIAPDFSYYGTFKKDF